MYIPFSDLDLQARVWIYQANRTLSKDETGVLTETLKSALDTWDAHGKPLTASGKVFENRFVVIGVDERDEMPSGCSIDKSVHWLQQIGSQLHVDFFDRSVAFYNANEEIEAIPVAKIKQAVAEEMLTPSTIVFNNQVTTKAQWLNKWKAPASHTWLARYFSDQPA
jgi:hypothetical protein